MTMQCSSRCHDTLYPTLELAQKIWTYQASLDAL